MRKSLMALMAVVIVVLGAAAPAAGAKEKVLTLYSPKIQTLSVAPLLAEAIKRIHHDQSISILFDRGED